MKSKVFSSLALLAASPAFAASTDISSPDGKLTVTVTDERDFASYSVSYQGQAVIQPSRLGLEFKTQAPLRDGFRIVANKTNSVDTTWQQPWGERREVRDHHNASTITFKHPDTGVQFNVTFKVFDDGLGFQYDIPTQPGFDKHVAITKELTEFALADADKTTAFWIPARGWNRYEYVYNTTNAMDAPLVHTPVSFKNQNGIHISIHEAALVDYAGMVLNHRRPGTFQADLTPWSDGIAVKKFGGFKTPWRTIQVAPEATGLLNSSPILNLNEPNKLGDVDWVKPGKYVGIWWGMHIGTNTWGSGEKHGATTANTKYFLDFAKDHGFDGVLVEGWNHGWDGDWFNNGDVFSFTKAYDDFDIAEVGRYAKERGVRLIGHHETSGNVSNYRNQMADAFALYEQHGVRQVKTGYVADGGNIKRIDDKGIARFEWHDGQFMVNEYLHNVTLAAKHKIAINTHEPIKDTGLRRTYPNWISREGARGQEFNAWGTPPNPPEHAVMLTYTRMLSGPMDFTPGIFDMGFNGLGEHTNRPQTTLAKQLALYVVLYSPIQMAADLPKNYLARPDAFQFIKDVPTDWEESIAIAGEIGDYTVFARKARARDGYNGKDWFLGAITDEHARDIDIKLDFLDQGVTYEAHIYRDGEGAEWKQNPYALAIEKRQVTAKDALRLSLATSGGTAIRFKAL